MINMKELTLHKIKEMAINSGRAVYNTSQLSNLIDKDYATASVYLTRLWKKGLAIRLNRGKISFVDNDFVIASQFIEPSYISLSSALLFHNKIQQIPRYVQSVTPVNSMKFDMLGLEYHKIPPGLMFGYERHPIAGSYCFVATIEKALLDGYYLNIFSLDDLNEYGNKKKLRQMKPQIEKFSARGKIKLSEIVK